MKEKQAKKIKQYDVRRVPAELDAALKPHGLVQAHFVHFTTQNQGIRRTRNTSELAPPQMPWRMPREQRTAFRISRLDALMLYHLMRTKGLELHPQDMPPWALEDLKALYKGTGQRHVQQAVRSHHKRLGHLHRWAVGR